MHQQNRDICIILWSIELSPDLCTDWFRYRIGDRIDVVDAYMIVSLTLNIFIRPIFTDLRGYSLWNVFINNYYVRKL